MFSSTGHIFTVTTWGESHGAAIGAVVDGVPSGLVLCEKDFEADMARRRPGSGEFSTARSEADAVEILSGVFEGVTTGTPISLLIRNNDARSRDYGEIAQVYRPAHADFTYDAKFGVRDYRGGGRSSGRETAARVAAGVIAKKILAEVGAAVSARIAETGEHGDETDSFGGVIEVLIENLPKGLGEPVFGKFDAALSAALMSIGAVKAVEIGAGFKAAKMRGSENNDPFSVVGGEIVKSSNNAGGILGGITDGSAVIARIAVKPTPSVPKPQKTVGKSGREREIEIKGRHDRCIAPRAVVVAEAMAALTAADFLLINMTRKIENVRKIYVR